MSFEHSPVIEEGYWRKPIDASVCMTRFGQFYKYFHQHVSQRHLKEWGGSFHRYAELPAELQLRILQQCDASTLFQLMHTTRALRIESSTLFFSDPTTWYRLQADFMIQQPLLAESIYDTCFLASVKQLEIHSPMLSSKTWLPEVEEQQFVSSEERSKFVNEHVKTNIQTFWRTIQLFCPQVKRVMFTRDGTSFPDKNAMMQCFQKIAQWCPHSLDVFFYTTEPVKEALGRRRKRVLWRLRASNERVTTGPTPKRENDSNAPKSIVIPPEKPHRGHVGDFITSRTVWEKYCGQHFAAEYHRAAAVEQHHFLGRREPFGCSVSDCDAWFDQPEQYTTHMLATRHGRGDTTHERVEALVIENKDRLDRLRQDFSRADGRFWDWWGEWPSTRRDKAEKEVMDQLERDLLYAATKPVAEHSLLKQIYQVENDRAV